MITTVAADAAEGTTMELASNATFQSMFFSPELAKEARRRLNDK